MCEGDVTFTPRPVFSPLTWLCLCADVGSEKAFLISDIVKVMCILRCIIPKLYS